MSVMHRMSTPISTAVATAVHLYAARLRTEKSLNREDRIWDFPLTFVPPCPIILSCFAEAACSNTSRGLVLDIGNMFRPG